MKRLLSVFLLCVLLAQLIVPGVAHAGDSWETDPVHFNTKVLEAETCNIALSAESFAYTGSPVTPAVEITYLLGGEIPIEMNAGTDYRISYSNNIQAGIARATVTGVGDYSGSVSASFVILPPKMKTPKPSAVNYSQIKAGFVRVAGADGYQLCIAPSGTTAFQYFDSDGKKAFLFQNLEDNKTYKIKIRAYVTMDGKRYYGPYSDYLSAKTKPAVAAPKIVGFSQLNAVPTLTWSAVKGATKYIVYRADSKNGKYTRIGTTTKCGYSDKKAKLHKSYYYVVRAYTVKSGKAYVSALSNKVKVQSKKTVFVGDSVMEGVRIYHGYDAASYVTKVGVGTYTFYNSNYFKVGKNAVTGVEKVISYQPDRVFIMLGMNEMTYKSHKAIFEYYGYIIEDIREACPGVQIVILPVSPTRATAPSNYPKNPKINAYNKDLKAFAKKMNCAYYDYTPAFKDASGYLRAKCDGGDGCHWNTYSAKLFITQIQKYIKTH